MTTYNYVFYSLRNEQVIAEIPLFGVDLNQKINGPGQMNASFQLDQNGKRNQDLTDATIPGRTAVAVERNGVAVWTGIVWSRTYQSQAKTCQLFIFGFEVYPSRQRILTTFNHTNSTYNIFVTAWTEMLSVAGRNLNINLPALGPFPDLPRSVVVDASEFKYYGEILSELSDAKDDGLDWTIDVTRVGSQYVKTLRVGVPTFGAEQSADQLIFEYPGCITNYYETESIASSATHLLVLGSGDGETTLKSEINLDSLIDADGWPRWDFDVNRKDVQNQTILDGIGQQQSLIRRPPMSVIKATAKANVDPVFGSYALGDNCTLVISDPKHAIPLQLSTRIIGWDLKPQSSSTTEEVSISFAMELDANG
jgi:hypothetical protein